MDRKDRGIPKIIHYCWFGGKALPENLQRCLDTWSILTDYKVMRWDESNCSFEENEFVRKTYAEKKWGYIGDYYRLKALYEYGGIYLDTDIRVNRTFDELLDLPVFLGFIYDCSVGTACIGARPGSPFIGALLSLYDATVFSGNTGKKNFEWEEGRLHVSRLHTSNYYFTWYILHHYPAFKLGNTRQDMTDFTIFPKEYFEIGRLRGDHYVVHLNTGSWIKDRPRSGIKQQIKKILGANEKLFEKTQIIVRSFRYKRTMKQIPFYACYQAQKKGEPLPEI